MKKEAWNHFLDRLHSQLNGKRIPLNGSDETSTMSLQTIQFIDTIKMKRLEHHKKNQYILRFLEQSWEIKSVLIHEAKVFVLWERMLQTRGWILTLLANKGITSIEEVDLI